MWFYQPIPAAAEVLSASRTIGVSDSLTVTLSDVGTLTAPLAQATDSIAVVGSDVSSISSSVSASDSCSVTLSDSARSPVPVFSVTDTTVVRLNGAASGSGGTANVSVTDSLTIGLTDAFTGSQACSVTDSLGVQFTEA